MNKKRWRAIVWIEQR